MQRTSDGRILVATDTSFLVNFLCIDRVDLLRGLRSYCFQVPNHVVAEVKREEQVERLTAALSDGTFTQFEIVDQVEIGLYAQLHRYLGDGESACLAVAATRRWVIACDEKGRLLREVVARLGERYLLNTPGTLVSALRLGLLSTAEAEEIRRELAAHRFVMKVPPFEDLLR